MGLTKINRSDVQHWYVALKQHLEEFIEVDHQLWSAIETAFTPYKLPRYGLLLEEGQVENQLHFVVSGALRAYHIKNGEEICVAFSYEKTITSVYGSFISRTPSGYYNEAVTDCELLTLEYHQLQTLFQEFKAMERFGRKAAEQVLIGKEAREIFLLSSTAKERYERIMKESPHVFQRYSMRDIASYLGMKPETLSRIRRQAVQK